MRRAKKEITDKDVIIGLLNTCHVGRIGTIGRDGYPMVKPLNFAYHDRKIYFHTAQEGEKIDDIKRDNRVCFEADLPLALVTSSKSPCKAEYLYQSVIIKGRAFLIEDAEARLAGLKLLMAKYQPEGGYGDFPEEKLKITGVVRIDIEEMIGKQDLGSEAFQEEIKKALERKERLPIVLESE